jgi:GNAT superfamily N-acetyltransferase
MINCEFRIIKAEQKNICNLIAQWYWDEWQILPQKTISRIQNATEYEFQMLLLLNGIPVATGGVYNHIPLLDRMPELNRYKPWMALIYTVPNHRGKGMGSLLCQHILQYAADQGICKMYLFAENAVQFYLNMGWKIRELTSVEQRNVHIMEIE